MISEVAVKDEAVYNSLQGLFKRAVEQDSCESRNDVRHKNHISLFRVCSLRISSAD